MINILSILIIIMLGWLLSGAIHELGHGIVGKMAGLNIDYIQILPPAVSFSGKTSDSWFAAISIAGPLFPVLIGVAGVLAAVLFKEKYPYVRYSVWIFLPMMMHSLIVLCAPIASAFGIKATNGDVTKFIEQSKWPPVVVSLIGLLLVGLCVIILKWAL